MDHNLLDNQVRYAFKNAPIVGPITIHETDTNIVILVATVTSVHRFLFIHPTRMPELSTEENSALGKNKPSIFYQTINQPQMSFRSFNLFDSAKDPPVPRSATSLFVQSSLNPAPETESAVIDPQRYCNGDSFFAFSYENGCFEVFKISKDDRLTMNEVNPLVRFLSGATPSKLRRAGAASTEAIVGLSFFNPKADDGPKSLYLVTLSMNGGIKLWMGSYFQGAVGWKLIQSQSINESSDDGVLNDSSIVLKKFNSTLDELPFFVVYLPGDGFRIYNVIKETSRRSSQVSSAPGSSQFILQEAPRIEFKIFKKEEDDLITAQDWSSLRFTAMNILDREMALSTSTTDFELADDDYIELCNRNWMQFYSACVEYHIPTVNPLGLFYENNTKMLCIVKKSRISFLRPTDSLETLYYFPCCVPVSENIDGGDDRMVKLEMMLKFFGVLEVIESNMDEYHREKIVRNLRNSHLQLETVCEKIVNYLTIADARSLHLECRHFISLITERLKDFGGLGDNVFRHVLSLLLARKMDGGFADNGGVAAEEDMETGEDGPVTEHFMGSRLGSHLSYKIMKQLLNHRYMISRNTAILQSLCVRCFSQNNEQEKINLLPSMFDVRDTVFATTTYFALLELTEKDFKGCPPIMKEKGLKVANSLKLLTGDHLNENFIDIQWPMKMLEGFCMSNLGGLSIRIRVSRSQGLGILAYAEAALRDILPTDPTTKDRPLEEFLITTCQYSTLLKYAQYMTTYFPYAKGTLRKFYFGLSHLGLLNFDIALNNFQSITFGDACDDVYFYMKYLEFPGIKNPPVELLKNLYAGYFLKTIKLFEIYDQTPAIQNIAEIGLKNAIDNDSVTQLCLLAFKSSIKLDDLKSAFKYMQKIPSPEGTNEVESRREKMASLRMLLARIVETGDVETLRTLKMDDMFNKMSTVGEKVEDILLEQAYVSDPLQKDGMYQLLCFYHLSRDSFHKAASVIYHRVIQLGNRGRGLDGLNAQHESLLDVVSFLSLMEDKEHRYVLRKTGVTSQLPERTNFRDNAEIPHLLQRHLSLEVLNYDDIMKELKLVAALLKVAKFLPPNPVKPTEFESRVQPTIDVLTQNRFYDDALNLAKVWEKPVNSIILGFTSSCAFIQCGIAPQTGDPFDYIKHIDVSEFPIGKPDVLKLSFRALRNYLLQHEKPVESGLYQIVADKLLSCGLPLPQWLIEDYKRRNCSQLLRCYMKYGIWQEATSLAMSMIDAVLGRCPNEEFDPSIQVISKYSPVEPVLPFTDINLLVNELKVRGRAEPNLLDMYTALKGKVGLFCDRVAECTAERQEIYCVQ
ncbi:unnamed protein product [Orchesella dallaii]|uniref:Nuclear pore complex protein n=1 Tax=Orchesella dallaii TaxID=48710 RepID=A0ABP1PTR3_9HEXA